MNNGESPNPQAGREAMEASRLFRLPFNRQTWRGSQGNWVGAGTGSSIDFQDHRDYQWGDDPRNIHWSAYARTGQLTMKLYRAELSPVIDIVADVSASMELTPEKAKATEALLLFCLLSADHAGAAVRFHTVNGTSISRVETDDIRNGRWRKHSNSSTPSAIMPEIPVWRANSMKILISDILYPGDPNHLLSSMAKSGGMSLLFAPSVIEEEDLPQQGNVYLHDCETGRTRLQLVTPTLAKKYRQAYWNHFALWQEAARRYHVHLARLPARLHLKDALIKEALKEGLVDFYR